MGPLVGRPSCTATEATLAGWDGSEEESEGQSARLVKCVLSLNASQEGSLSSVHSKGQGAGHSRG